ncbi:MAG: TlpA family protein disulfide reductase [Fimbriimonadaceae bacterium]|nr:MAG: TlpA family protein disulfide reductase [Fimbriimonadaceae bacterium]
MAKDVEVGTTFKLSTSAPTVQIGYANPGIRTGSDGKFRIPREECYNGMVVASTSTKSGFAEIPSQGTLKIQLLSLQKVNISLASKEKVSDVMSSSTFSSKGKVIGYGSTTWGDNLFVLPQGDLSVDISHKECRTAKVAVTFPSTLIQMQITKWKTFIGKNAPEITATEPKDFKFKSLRGKWVVVDYWATWCAPCISAFPEWFEFVKKNSSRRNKFEILAIHSPDGESREQIEGALNSIIKNKWSGVIPPFPLIFDKTGNTHDKYGIEAYPTTLLIDPNGILVGETNPEDLQRRLDSQK